MRLPLSHAGAKCPFDNPAGRHQLNFERNNQRWRNPTVPEVAVFGRFFNVSFDYLLGKSEDRIAKDFIEEAGGNRRLASILQLMRSLSKEEAEAVLQKLLTMDLTSPEK